MEPIHVPRPPKEAFNKHRPVSDLIRSQVEHFRHVENKLSPEQRSALPQGHIRTDHEAAEYIRAMTGLLLSNSAPAAQSRPIVMPARPAQLPARGLALAAGVEEPKAAEPKTAKKSAHRSRKAKKGKKR